MNIYIKMEVLRRELEGRLLLALVAAERGHHVLLGDLRSLLSHRLWLPAGVYHDKSLTPSRRKLALHRRLVEAGFRVTSQDEEHGLLDPEYDGFLRARFSKESLGQATTFTWGPYDTAALQRAFPSLGDHIRATGSPRTDLWRRDFDAFYHRQRHARPYVLVPASGSGLFRIPFWEVLRDYAVNYAVGRNPGPAWIRTQAAGLVRTAAFIETVLGIAATRPDIDVIVRPHPTEDPSAWRVLLGESANVIVSDEGGVSRWVRGAAAVLHGGTTTAIEAVACGVPTVCLDVAQAPIDRPHAMLGVVVPTIEDAVAAVVSAIDGDGPQVGATDKSTLDRLLPLEGRYFADRIVDVWEESVLPRRPFSARLRRSAGAAHAALGARRGSPASEGGFPTAHKFPGFSHSEIDGLVHGLRAATGRFSGVEFTVHGARLVELMSSR